MSEGESANACLFRCLRHPNAAFHTRTKISLPDRFVGTIFFVSFVSFLFSLPLFCQLSFFSPCCGFWERHLPREPYGFHHLGKWKKIPGNFVFFLSLMSHVLHMECKPFSLQPKFISICTNHRGKLISRVKFAKVKCQGICL